MSQDPGRDKAVDFGRPPVVEVALTVQFARPVAGIAALAAFVTKLADEFPVQTLQPPLPRVEEAFDRPHGVPTFEMRFEQAVRLPRTWLTGAGPYLVQIQPDRLALNWRRDNAASSSDYPGYATIRTEFLRHLESLAEVVASNHGSPLEFQMCEVFYVNPIQVPGHDSRSFHPDLASVLNLVAPATPSSFIGAPEDATLQARWRIPGNDVDRPIGRLYLAANPSLDPKTLLPIYLVTLTGHVVPDEPGRDAAVRALDTAHDWIVKGFEDITTQEMHRVWDHHPRIGHE